MDLGIWVASIASNPGRLRLMKTQGREELEQISRGAGGQPARIYWPSVRISQLHEGALSISHPSLSLPCVTCPILR